MTLGVRLTARELEDQRPVEAAVGAEVIDIVKLSL